MILLFSSLLSLLQWAHAQQENTYWGSYDLTIPGGSGAGNAVDLLKLPENAPSFFDFSAFTGPEQVAPAPAFQPAVQQTLPVQRQQPVQQQFRPQQQVQQQFRQQQQPVQQQFRQQQQAQQQFRPQQSAQQRNQQTQAILQQAREQQAAVQRLQQQAAPQNFLSANRIEFLPANSNEAQQIRQQIVSGQFNPQPINSVPQRVAPTQRPVQVPQRVSQPSRPQRIRPTQQRAQTLNSALEKLRVFAAEKPKQVEAQPAVPVPSPQSQQQPRFSNFRPSNRGRSQSVPRQEPIRQSVPRQEPIRQPVQAAPQPRGRTVVQPTPQTLEPQKAPVEEVPEFNDYDSGEHKLSRFQLFQLRKQKEAGEALEVQPKVKVAPAFEVQPRVIDEPEVEIQVTVDETPQVPQRQSGKRRKFAVRRRKNN